jgi:hypothetical protein
MESSETSTSGRKSDGERKQQSATKSGFDALPQFSNRDLQEQLFRWSSQAVMRSHEHLIAQLECHRKLMDSFQSIARDAQNTALEATRRTDSQDKIATALAGLRTCGQASADAQMRSVRAFYEFWLNTAGLAGNMWRGQS